jgi:hypothetical protein
VKGLGESGFSGREKYGTSFFKKYLFIVYSLSIIFPFLDAAALSISRADVRYFIHLPLCMFTAYLILYNYAIKFLGVKPKLREYGS